MKKIIILLLFRALCIGISIGISLVHIFSPETIAMWVAIAFLALEYF